MKKKVVLSIIVIVFSVGCSSTGGSGSSGKQCRSVISETGSGHPKSTARSNAKAAWSNLASTTYAPSFSSWSRARNKSSSCVHTSGRWPTRTFTCTYSAEPCSKN